tara:strand:+ start:421 stop:1515 length:1095 start_codon:yes stop_codon:yes gene_type:complete
MKNQIRGIYKRGNVYWIRYSAPDGKIIRESCQTASKKDAEYLLSCRRKDVREGKFVKIKEIKKYSFNELVSPYLEWAKRQKAFKSKRDMVNKLVAKFGNYPLNSFNTRIIEKLQTDILLDGKKPATANRYLATIKHMFTKAVEWEMENEETLKKVRAVKFLPEDNKRLRYLSKEECICLVDSCSPHLKPIIITALNTGMRKGEILSLEWRKHIDLKHGFILLDKTKNGKRREVPINSTLRNALSRIIRRIDSPYVFANGDGERYGDVKRSFKTALRCAGIMDFKFHDLRHTFASQLVMAGVDLTTVKELLGHATLTMTLRYAHLAPSHKVKAVDILDNVISEKKITAQKLHSLKIFPMAVNLTD